MLAPPLADFLRSRRADCNARFAAARRRWPRLGAEEFSLFLRDQLSPLALALAEKSPALAPRVLASAYDLGLQLVAEKLAGPSAIHPLGNALWTGLFPRLATLAATAPRRVLGSLVNAAQQLLAHPGARADDWLARLAALAPSCETPDQVLALAQVLAWRAGLAHYRGSALAVADTLPASLALAALDAPVGLDWTRVRDAHLRNIWFGYDADQRPVATEKLARRIGAFRGFGGHFLVPPTAATNGAHLLVRSGDETWVLLADAFGATLHRATLGETTSVPPSSRAPAKSSILPAGHTPTSWIVHGPTATYALTSAQSHSVWVGPLLAG